MYHSIDILYNLTVLKITPLIKMYMYYHDIITALHMDKIDHVFLSVDQILYGLLFIKETIYLNYDFKIL